MWVDGLIDDQFVISGSGVQLRPEYGHTLYFLNDELGNGRGDSAYVRVGHMLSQVVLEMGFLQKIGSILKPVYFGSHRPSLQTSSTYARPQYSRLMAGLRWPSVTGLPVRGQHRGVKGAREGGDVKGARVRL